METLTPPPAPVVFAPLSEVLPEITTTPVERYSLWKRLAIVVWLVVACGVAIVLGLALSTVSISCG